jgi:hypothetical protein
MCLIMKELRPVPLNGSRLTLFASGQFVRKRTVTSARGQAAAVAVSCISGTGTLRNHAARASLLDTSGQALDP